ncbi:hypothetical protein DXG01_004736 [Tephrocybe rancida]|nr:hypothetical protein DXG01_004736 [Tephrocybe rancida]
MEFSRLALAILIALLVIFCIHPVMRRSTSHWNGIPVVYRTLPTLKRLLSPPNASTRDLLASRALPNRRLIRAFALTNTFVSAETVVHTAFIARATSLLKAATDRGWTYFHGIAVDAVEQASHDGCEIPFDTFVQDVTMRVALVALLDIDASVGELDQGDISAVSNLITLLWSLSKKPDPIPAELLPQLNHHLRRLIPNEEAYPNPLDFVIPVWETLWRVVAVCVAYAQHYPKSADIFSNLHALPTLAQFRFADETSVEWFVTEAMRLHPPSKRIARASLIYPFSTFFTTSLAELAADFRVPLVRYECADIESVLRSRCIWGSDADIFDPLRFHSSKVSQEQEKIKYLPFGQGRYKCIAATWAPMAAGLISAAILDRFQRRGHLLRGESLGGREGWQGWSVVN